MARPGTVSGGLDIVSPRSHTTGMTSTTKIAVSLPKLVAERARRAVRKGYAASVSAYVASALEEKVKLDELSTLLDEMLAESGGPLTPAERRAADRALGAGKKRSRRKAAVG
jgi:Arc/MetJ-type ribon-helix-helix transcriptional regulator